MRVWEASRDQSEGRSREVDSGVNSGSILVNSRPYLGNLIINLRFSLHLAVGRARALEIG